MIVDSLEHHGIKGMKWGIRRYQNRDGSLTPEGRKRYQISQADEEKLMQAHAYRKQLEKAARKETEKDQISRENLKKIKDASRLDNSDPDDAQYVWYNHQTKDPFILRMLGKEGKDTKFWQRFEKAELLSRTMNEVNDMPKKERRAAMAFAYELIYGERTGPSGDTVWVKS